MAWYHNIQLENIQIWYITIECQVKFVLAQWITEMLLKKQPFLADLAAMPFLLQQRRVPAMLPCYAFGGQKLPFYDFSSLSMALVL